MNTLKEFINKSEKKFIKIEPYIFLMLCIIGILPVLYTKYYVTLDGPAHLYNANLIKELILGKSSEISNLFTLNRFPLPNWSGHLFMALFNLIFPSFVSEKIVFLIYFILTPIFFRKFVLHFYPENRIITYFILLFLHNQILYFGFLNMSLGIMFLFATCLFFVKHCSQIKIKNILILTLLLLSVYFSHIFIFLIAIIVLAITLLLKMRLVQSDNYFKITNLKELFRSGIILIISIIPGLILTICYMVSVDSIEKQPRPELAELIKWIFDIRPLLTLCYCEKWTNLSHILTVLFALLILCNIYIYIKNTFKVENDQITFKIPFRLSSILWFSSWFLFLFLFLILPNSILITERLILLVYLFFIVWLACLKYPKFITYVSLITVLYLQIRFVDMHLQPMHQISRDVEKMMTVTKNIKQNCLVLTFNYSDNWLHSHITGYLGSNNAIPVLENYEAQLKWFPVQWNRKIYKIDKLDNWGVDNRKLANDFYINSPDSNCFSLKYTNNQIKEIPYVFVIGKPNRIDDPLSSRARKIFKENYEMIDTNSFCSLYKLKTF
jgi:hypothetical protein